MIKLGQEARDKITGFKGIFNGKDIDTIVLVIDNIHDFIPINNGYVMIFDSDSTFYFIDNFRHKISQRQTIMSSESTNTIHWGKSVSKEVYYLGGQLISIYYGRGEKANRTMKETMDGSCYYDRHLLYDIKNDCLYQDIESILKSENR